MGSRRLANLERGNCALYIPVSCKTSKTHLAFVLAECAPCLFVTSLRTEYVLDAR